MKKTNLLSLIIFGLITLASSITQANIIYSVTTDGIINNSTGTWGGDLLVGENQAVNLTVEYTWENLPSKIDSDYDIAYFYLKGMQVFDNTNGLKSDLLDSPNTVGNMRYKYSDVAGEDIFAGALFGSPFSGGTHGGSLVLGLGPWLGYPELKGEFGDLGDIMPHGKDFDDLVNQAGIRTLIARAPDYTLGNNISGINGIEDLLPGTFVFSSRIANVPEPGLLSLLLLGSLSIAARRKKA